MTSLRAATTGPVGENQRSAAGAQRVAKRTAAGALAAAGEALVVEASVAAVLGGANFSLRVATTSRMSFRDDYLIRVFCIGTK